MMAKAAAREIVYRACTHPGRRQSAAGAYVQVARIFSENVYEWWSRSIAELADAVIEKVSRFRVPRASASSAIKARASEYRAMSMRSFDAYVKSMTTVVMVHVDIFIRNAHSSHPLHGVPSLAALAAPHQLRVRVALGLEVPEALAEAEVSTRAAGHLLSACVLI